jgi:hypothetical protein
MSEKNEAPARAGVLLFLLVFLRGVLEKVGAERGVFVVRSWWIAGKTWCVVDRFPERKNTPLF